MNSASFLAWFQTAVKIGSGRGGDLCTVVPVYGSHLESYKVIPKRNYLGAYGKGGFQDLALWGVAVSSKSKEVYLGFGCFGAPHLNTFWDLFLTGTILKQKFILVSCCYLLQSPVVCLGALFHAPGDARGKSLML